MKGTNFSLKTIRYTSTGIDTKRKTPTFRRRLGKTDVFLFIHRSIKGGMGNDYFTAAIAASTAALTSVKEVYAAGTVKPFEAVVLAKCAAKYSATAA